MKTFFFIFNQKVGSIFIRKTKVIKPRKMFRLCVRDEFGTRTLDKPALVLKSTALRHEIQLRTGRWKVSYMNIMHRVYSWWTDNTGTIRRLSSTIDNALRKYRERRFEAGLFYLDGHRKNMTYTVRSHLYGNSEFLRDLWRKKRLERIMIKHNKDEFCNSSASVREFYLSEDTGLSSIVVGTLRLCGMRHVFYLFLLIAVALAIVYL
jgi:hypothetical protein